MQVRAAEAVAGRDVDEDAEGQEAGRSISA
jgi:hypothetical protein